MLRVELKLRRLRIDRRGQLGVLVLRPEELLDDVEGLLINFEVLVRLEEFDLVETVALLNGDRVSVDARIF